MENTQHFNENIMNLFGEAWEYMEDAGQRSVLFMDILRKRGNIYNQHMAEGKPPVLTFDYKIVIDGRDLEKPVNYGLVKIIDKRRQPVFKEEEEHLDRRAVVVETRTRRSKSKRRPIVIIDPRAGHGPGIGGSKRDSEIGMALALGHPVYFVIFFPEPEPGQTLADVQRAEVIFLEKIISLHPEAEKPAVIGNCQGGWAAALIGADRPDVTGPLIFNGSPLSYWAGVEGKNPMRYKGGLLGGTWIASLWSDLGGGKFDGANLVAGFEDLNPANTFWAKQYNVYSNVDTEENRYLDFERWWNAYYFMTTEEIHFIVNNLFVGNRLEQGLLELDKKTIIDLKNIEDPVLVFASSGDNITPPQQALNWIVKVWGSVEELKRHRQVVVYLIHSTIGHLGIFVSAKVSKKEHKEIIGSIDLMEYLSPGLYEMVIVEGQETLESGDYEVRFEEREISDILSLDDGLMDEEDFRVVSAVSDFNDEIYLKYFSPLVKMFTSELSAEYLRQRHHLRWSRYLFSDQNPFMFPFGGWAAAVKENRKPVSEDNSFISIEKSASQTINKMFDTYCEFRDNTQELWFRTIYGNPFVQSFFEKRVEESTKKEQALQKLMVAKRGQEEERRLLDAMEKGGFVEGVLRLMVAMAGADRIIDQKELRYIRELIIMYNVLADTTEAQLKRKMQNQARILQLDEDKALNTLPLLIRGAENRLVAIQIAENLAEADSVVTRREKKLLTKIKGLLHDQKLL